VEAVSGRTGQRLWRVTLPGAWFLTSGTGNIPMSARWPTTRSEWARSGGYGGSLPDEGPYAIHSFSFNGAWEFAHVPFAAEAIWLARRPVVVCMAGTRLVGWEGATGRPAWLAYVLGFAPCRPPQFADLDGAAEPEVALAYDRPNA